MSITKKEKCLFCNIVQHQLPADIIYENKDICIFLDTRPLFPGHTLLVPTTHYETLLDLPKESVTTYFLALQEVTAVVKKAMAAEGVFVAMNNVVSQSVPHLHTHVVPRNKGDGLKGFFWPRQKYLEGQLDEVAEKLRSCWQQLKND
jgi:histidine triad (HIT) family protein